MAGFELDPDEVGRELVLTVPLPVERPKPAVSQPKEHRFRPQDVALAARIRPFRALHDLTQAEVALAVGAAGSSTVTQWEQGVNVPDGMRRRNVVELLKGQRWRLLRESLVASDACPERWEQAVRWYRRTSRDVPARRALAEPILSTLKELRALSTAQELRDHYPSQERGWAVDPAWTLPPGATGRLVEDCAYGLRWVEVVAQRTVDVRRSLVPQLSNAVLSALAPAVGASRRRQAARRQGTPNTRR